MAQKDKIHTNTGLDTPSDNHVVKMWTPYNINVDENFKFIPDSRAYNAILNVLRAAALAILKIVDKVVFDLKVEDRENLNAIEKGHGFVSVSNHVSFLDCTMLAIAMNRTDLKITVLKENFEIPFVRLLVKASGALPIPEIDGGKPKFAQAISELLKRGNVVHFYPEAVLFPGYNGIRGFHKGAFVHAVKNNVPVLPFVITFHKPSMKCRKRPAVTIRVLPPVYADKTLGEYERILDLRDKTSSAMKKAFNEEKNCLRDNAAVLKKYGEQS